METRLGGFVGVAACLFVAVHGGCSSSESTSGNPAGSSALGGGAGASNGGSGGATGGSTTGGAGAGGSSGQAGGAGGSGGAGATGGAGSGGMASGGASAGAGAGGAATGGSGAGEAGAPAGGSGPCDDYEGLATPEQVATTPRADAEIEILALRAGDTLLASDEVYARVERDLAAIRAGYPDVVAIMPRLRANPSRVLVIFDDDTIDDVEAGSYTGWDCPNALYRATDIADPVFNSVTISFEGRFEPEILGTEYANLPGVTTAGASVGIGDGDDISIDVDGSDYHWIFIHGSGDCTAGCIGHDYWGFTTNAGGDITYEGTSSDDSLDQGWLDEHLDITSLP